jgi:hypothetical protein
VSQLSGHEIYVCSFATYDILTGYFGGLIELCSSFFNPETNLRLHRRKKNKCENWGT